MLLSRRPSFILPAPRGGLPGDGICHTARASAAHAQQAVKPVAASAAQPPSNAITQAAVQQGVLNCAGRINQVSAFLGYTSQAGALLMTPPAQPDQRLIPLAMEVPASNGSA